MDEDEKLNKFLRDREECRERIEPHWQDYKKSQPDRIRKLTKELEKIGRQFTPWVGNNYADCEGHALSGFGVKVLVVGDSTHLGKFPEGVFKLDVEKALQSAGGHLLCPAAAAV
jgi:hypothetical protein